jgi:hypothetical protein
MLEEFFSPRAVAVIGASRQEQKLGYTVLNNIAQGGFREPTEAPVRRALKATHSGRIVHINNRQIAQLAKLVYSVGNEARCRREVERMAVYLRGEVERRGLPDVDVIGPAPSFRRRLRGRFRWQVVVRGTDVRHPGSRAAPAPQGNP